MKSPKTHVYYVPHADDETLTLGTAILESMESGAFVYLVLLTDGSGDGTLDCLLGKHRCRWHQQHHDPVREGFLHQPFTCGEFSLARCREFQAAVEMMGVPESQCRMESFVDGALSRGQMRQLVMELEQNSSLPHPISHRTLSYHFDDHTDHLVAGGVLRELENEGVICGSRWHVKRTWQERVLASAAACRHVDGNMTEWSPVLIQITQKVYQNYQPSQGHYAIGYHSVPESFQKILSGGGASVEHQMLNL